MLVVQRKQDLVQAAYLRQKIKMNAYPSDSTVEKVFSEGNRTSSLKGSRS